MFKKLYRLSTKAAIEKLVSTIKILRYRQNSHATTYDRNWGEVNFNRIALVGYLGSRLSRNRYLEIGCAKNTLFDSLFFDYKVGVDPVKGGTLRMTSNQFFEKNVETFDLVFIDGLHTYEQVRQDVINALRTLSSFGWIALHDMLPNHWVEAHVPRLSNGNWTGDVWKLAFELRDMPGIDFRIVEIDNGVGVIRKTELFDEENFSSSNRFDNEKYTFFVDNQSRLPIISWNDFTSWVTDTSDASE
jgi:hypothetical protein